MELTKLLWDECTILTKKNSKSQKLEKFKNLVHDRTEEILINFLSTRQFTWWYRHAQEGDLGDFRLCISKNNLEVEAILDSDAKKTVKIYEIPVYCLWTDVRFSRYFGEDDDCPDEDLDFPGEYSELDLAQELVIGL